MTLSESYRSSAEESLKSPSSKISRKMPSRFQTACKSFRGKMTRKAVSVIKIDNEWSRQDVLLSIANNRHMGVEGKTPHLTLVHGTEHPEIDTFTFSTTDVFVDNRIAVLCYFSHQIDDVIYYVTSRGSDVVLQTFETEPDVTKADGRLFEVSANKKWCQFRGFGSEGLYLCYDSSGFCMKKQTTTNRTPFNFDLIEREKGPLIK